jgi:hypothetical protein
MEVKGKQGKKTEIPHAPIGIGYHISTQDRS